MAADQNHVGGRAKHFRVTAQLGAADTDNLVDDQVRHPAAQIGIARDSATQPGSTIALRIVQDQPRGPDVELLVLVVGNTRRIGCGDIDHCRPRSRLTGRGAAIDRRDLRQALERYQDSEDAGGDAAGQGKV